MPTYTEATQSEPQKKKKTYNNLTKSKKTSIKELHEREETIITKANKGGAIAIVAANNYKKEGERRLNNTNNYRKLQKDPTATNINYYYMIEQKHSKNKNYYIKVSEELKKNDQKTPKLFPMTKNPGGAVVSLLNFVIQQIFENTTNVNYHL